MNSGSFAHKKAILVYNSVYLSIKLLVGYSGMYWPSTIINGSWTIVGLAA